MRKILFRGKRIGNGEWVEGFYVERDNTSWIYPAGNQMISRSLARELRPMHSAKSTQKIMREVFPVDPDTVGQYTGLQDKNGKRIFEGDILKTHYANAKNSEFVEVVVFRNGRFCAEGNLGGGGRSWALLWDGVPHIPQDKTIYMDGMEIIGNIHDNPELLEADHEG